MSPISPTTTLQTASDTGSAVLRPLSALATIASAAQAAAISSASPAPKVSHALSVPSVLPPYHEWFPPGTLAELVPDPARRERLIAEIPRLPVAYFDEPAPLVRFAESVACAFVRLGAPFDAAADKAQRLGWWVTRRDWDHLRMLSAPEAVADLIAQAISATQPR